LLQSAPRAPLVETLPEEQCDIHLHSLGPPSIHGILTTSTHFHMPPRAPSLEDSAATEWTLMLVRKPMSQEAFVGSAAAARVDRKGGDSMLRFGGSAAHGAI
jgi:hypothetical protein